MPSKPWTDFPVVVSANQFGPKFLIKELFPLADRMRDVAENGGNNSLQGHEVFLLFYEASTRTITSFKRATKLLGADYDYTESARQFSSAIKGESLEDTVRILNGYYYSLIVIRYDETGGAARAARASEIPVINAGDGNGEHPTQALLDLYTIYSQFSHFDGLRVALVGDLHNSRTIHSLATLLAKMGGVELSLVSPSKFRIDDHHTRPFLVESGCKFKEVSNLMEVAGEVDVVYLTRLQTERLKAVTKSNALDWGGEGNVCVCINDEVLGAMQKEAIILHPLPRSDDFVELPEKLDTDPRVQIFQQAQNGLFVRMALLEMILGVS